MDRLSGPTEFFMYDTTKFTNAVNTTAPFGKDPVATGWAWAMDLPENLFVAGARNYSTGLGDYAQWVRINLYNPFLALANPLTYAIAPPPGSDGYAVVLYNDASFSERCEGTSGSVVLSASGPAGAYVQGEYTVTGWQNSGVFTCFQIAPKSGSFLIKRGADDREQNDGQAIDTITLTDDFGAFSLTENNTTPNDPALAAEYDASGAGSMFLYLSLQADRSLGIYQRQFYFEYGGGTGSFDYSLSQFVINVYYSDGTGSVACPITSGTLNISSDGGVGGLIAGNFSLALSSPPPGCPSTFINASFAVTRMADF